MTLYEQTFWRQLDEISSLQHKGPDSKNAFHDRPFVTPTRKNQHHMAKQYQQRVNDGKVISRGELNAKIELVRNSDSQIEEILSPSDCDYILNNYNLDELPSDAEHPKNLFDGVKIWWVPNKNSYVLRNDK